MVRRVSRTLGIGALPVDERTYLTEGVEFSEASDGKVTTEIGDVISNETEETIFRLRTYPSRSGTIHEEIQDLFHEAAGYRFRCLPFSGSHSDNLICLRLPFISEPDRERTEGDISAETL